MTDSKICKLSDDMACSTCRHSRFTESGAKCHRFQKWDPVLGWYQDECSYWRKANGECGLGAKGWEARVPPPWIIANFGAIIFVLAIVVWVFR